MARRVYEASLHRLTRWHTVFAGWQLGTRPADDPECAAVRDHRDSTMVMRAELTALTRLCLAGGPFTEEQYLNAVAVEADFLSESYEQRFPGFKATDEGLVIDPALAAQTMRGWRP